MDGTGYQADPVPFFSVQVKNGVTTLTNRAPDQPSFLANQSDVEGKRDALDLTNSPECRSCNCRNSKCLKLYCECFASAQYCVGCNCNNCMNTPQFEKERLLAVQNIRQRNPEAFKTRSTSNKREFTSCRCKKSGCSKKYCECFQNSLACSDACQCTDCQNPFDLKLKKTTSPKDVHRPRLDLSLIDPAIVKLTRDMVSAAQRLSDQEAAHDLLTLSFLSPTESDSGRKPQFEDVALDGNLPKEPPSPNTARLLCDEAPDMPGVVGEKERSDLFRQQEIEIISRLDDYLKDLISGSNIGLS